MTALLDKKEELQRSSNNVGAGVGGGVGSGGGDSGKGFPVKPSAKTENKHEIREDNGHLYDSSERSSFSSAMHTSTADAQSVEDDNVNGVLYNLQPNIKPGTNRNARDRANESTKVIDAFV